MYHLKGGCKYFFHLEKIKKQNTFRGNFKNFKRAVISCSKMCRLKIFVTYRTSNEPSKFGIRFLAIVI